VVWYGEYGGTFAVGGPFAIGVPFLPGTLLYSSLLFRSNCLFQAGLREPSLVTSRSVPRLMGKATGGPWQREPQARGLTLTVTYSLL
jgi:hypothetical protein